MRTIGVVTGARSDYSIYLPVLRAIEADPELKLEVYVTGMHLSAEFGMTVKVIEGHGFPIVERVESLLPSDEPAAIAKSMGRGVTGFAEVFERHRPDILLVLGDRVEMLAAVVASLPFTIPIAHISGGEVTEGVIDESIRHAITKMSHLHFVAAEPYRQRVIQMGEEPWRVATVGEPSLDGLKTLNFISREELERGLEMSLEPAPVLVTFHPATLEYAEAEKHAAELLAALEFVNRPIIFTGPNADAGGAKIRKAIEGFVASHPRSKLVVNFGPQAYFSVLKIAACMVGNSSSGVVEAASFELPVVNVGDRQKGRIHAANVMHAACERSAIGTAIAKALDPDFRKGLAGVKNPYGEGSASPQIVRILKETLLGKKLLCKKFHDLDSGRNSAARSVS